MMRSLAMMFLLVVALLTSCTASTPAPTPMPTPTPAPIPEEIELKYDDGTSDGSCSCGARYGYLVHFSPPTTPFAISKVKTLTSLKGSGYESQTVWYEIRDQNLGTLYYLPKPVMSFNHEPTWVTVEMPDITVNGDFYVFFYPCSTREGGVYLHYDSSQVNSHSEMAELGVLADWGWWEQMPKEKTNWMIRVVGAPADKVVSVPSMPFQVIEGTAEFQEIVSSLDKPEKLSQWMIDNIEWESTYEREKETGVRYTSPPDETFKIRRGNCRAFAVFACYILQYHGYEAETLSIKVESNERYNHAVCVYHYDGLLYAINNGRIEGPYQTYEDIASNHHEDWSRYEIHYSWDKFQKLGPPDEVSHKEVAIASIEGRVVDFSTRQPVEKAIVNIGNESSFTDSSGNYVIAHVPVGFQTIKVIAEGYQDYRNTIKIEKDSNVIEDILIEPETVPESVSGHLLTYRLSLKEDARKNLHMQLHVRNIKSDSLRMVINNTIMDDYENVYDIFEIVSNLSVTNPAGNALPFDFSQTTIVPENWYLSWWRNGNRPIHYDAITIDTKGNRELLIEYDIISSVEMWLAFGADSTFPNDHPRDFWAGYLEWLLYRPQEHADVCSAKLITELPEEWRFATIYPSLGNEVDLGKMDYMYGDNIRWKNYQRSNFILFKDGPFRLASKMIKGTLVQDVYSARLAGQRNHQAGFQYFEYFCDSIGPLPVYAVLTFFPSVHMVDTSPVSSAPYIDYLRLYQAGPYGWSHGLMGEYFGTGGDIGFGSGRSLPQVQLWDFNSLDDKKSYSFLPHGTARFWLPHLLQVDSAEDLWVKEGLTTYYENMCVASKYGTDEVVERRFKPMYRYYLENIAGPPEVDEINFTNHSFLSYFKDALVFFYINELLKEQSGGAKNLDDAMKPLYEDALAGKPVSRESLIGALNSLTEYDFTQVVDDYLYGNKALDLAPWLK